MSTGVLERLAGAIDAIPLVDTHEHLPNEARRVGQAADLFSLTDYVAGDLVAAGMPVEVLTSLSDRSRALDARWRDFAPFWRHVRATGYGQALRIAARDLFGVGVIDDSTYADLSERIAAANSAGWYDSVLTERANIEVAANQAIPEFDPTPIEEMDRRYFRPVVCLNDFLTPSSRTDLLALERRSGCSIRALDDLVAAIDQTLERTVAAGAVALKILLAYRRTLQFESVTTADAERVFNRLGRHSVSWLADLREPPVVSWDEARPMQDFLVHRLVRRCADIGLPIQVHTGLQFGNGNNISNADPNHLANLFARYPEARFDLFHAGYPFHSVTATLGKTFPNVWVDLCWVPAISPWIARRILHEWIETVPANKIMAFGGDATVVEGAYAHARMARDAVARVLAEQVETGRIGEDEARYLAVRLLRENAREFLGLAGAPGR